MKRFDDLVPLHESYTLLPAAGIIPAALAASTVAVIYMLFSNPIASASTARQQRRAHLLLYLPYPVAQGSYFRDVHNWDSG
jgi:hypothetical protein